MEQGSELSKTVATFILQKILTDDTGLAYICQTYERFSHVAKVLGLMVLNLGKPLPRNKICYLCIFIFFLNSQRAVVSFTQTRRALLPSTIGQPACQRSLTFVSARSTQRSNVRRLPERRREHQEMARSTHQEPRAVHASECGRIWQRCAHFVDPQFDILGNGRTTTIGQYSILMQKATSSTKKFGIFNFTLYK